ncbi:carotenoid cleavage dioxygenase [Plenodomus tracheiphilus IPT5]|uniref:Carotenoid cleavage dioxygenase n=1 Tax=Plenodomus tracheiphilus IPT5 TaxID=1408161 RepID=A0A6A7B0H8_9PLEO|nr:carotenoid cleavage dioxygenase [Plenodomus tracheiphilus IPT5]
MAPSKLQSFSLDQQPPVPVDQDDMNVLKLLNATEHNQSSVYNYPGYKPIFHELSQVDIEVTGTLPSDLQGVYLRNGTNIQFQPTSIRLHAFSGAGMIHQIQLQNGKATYSNFYIRTPRFEIERKIGREVYVEFSDIAGAGSATLEKIKALQSKVKKGLLPDFSQYELTPGSTSIRYHSGRLYCLQETGYAFVLDARHGENGALLLDGRGHLETWDGEWEGPFSAHPRVDPATGDMYNLSLGDQSVIMAGRISKGLRHSQAAFEQSRGSMGWLHDFFLTDKYIVFPDISMRRDFSGLMGSSGSVFHFDHEYNLRFGVIPREYKTGDKVTWFTTKRPSSIWHVINAWEQTGPNGSRQILLFSPCFDDYPAEAPIHTPAEPPAKVLLDHHYERPSVNLDYVGRPSRYCYLLDEECDGYMGKGVLKYDLIDKKEVGSISYGDMYGGEAYFVPRANPRSEDDGYLLDILMTGEKSDLIVVDALTMKEVARLHLPQRVPFGVHATWLSEEEAAGLS